MSAVCGVLLVALNVSTIHDWRWVAVGVVVGVVVLGPLAQSPIGQRAESAFRDIGFGGRILVMAAGIIAVLTLLFLSPIPGEITVDAMVGSMLLIPVYVVAHLLVARDIGGLSPD